MIEGSSVDNRRTNAIKHACATLGVNSSDAVPLHGRANAVYLLPHANAVLRLRLTRHNQEWEQRLAISVEVTRWLAEQGFPTVVPLPIDQPISIDGWTATFWKYEAVQRSEAATTVVNLAELLRQLHATPAPPIDLPETDPLGSLQTDLCNDNILNHEHREWLSAQVDDIKRSYPRTPLPLDKGLIHGDAHAGNILHVVGDRSLLGDWDSVSRGPRVQDLIPTLHRVRHFEHPYAEWRRLCVAYGVDADIEHHPGVQLLQRARELRSLAAYIRGAAQSDIRAELEKRLRTLMTGYPEAWTLV
jgi:Ser/Thr protein kinase RdoA (MazF antagonist)